MIAYEFYCGDCLVGILPERRKNPGRVTEASIMKWVRNILNDRDDIRRVFFVRVNLEEPHNVNSSRDSEPHSDS